MNRLLAALVTVLVGGLAAAPPLEASLRKCRSESRADSVSNSPVYVVNGISLGWGVSAETVGGEYRFTGTLGEARLPEKDIEYIIVFCTELAPEGTTEPAGAIWISTKDHSERLARSALEDLVAFQTYHRHNRGGY